MRLLEENPEMSQRELAKTVGISVGSTNYVMNAPRGVSEKTALTRLFLRCKRDEYEALREEIAALEHEVQMSNGR